MSPWTVAAIVRFAWPAYDADSIGCAPGSDSLLDLAFGRLLGVVQGAETWTPETLATVSAEGKAGRPDSIQFDDRGRSWLLYLETIDDSGNVSCPSPRLAFGDWPVGVGEPHEEPASAGKIEREWFDVSGRKLEGTPTASGVYFVRERIGSRVIHRRRMVLLR